jgi:hypothetical protein
MSFNELAAIMHAKIIREFPDWEIWQEISEVPRTLTWHARWKVPVKQVEGNVFFRIVPEPGTGHTHVPMPMQVSAPGIEQLGAAIRSAEAVARSPEAANMLIAQALWAPGR